MVKPRNALWRACIAALLLVAAASAQAQGYPNKPIRVILPYAAGGFSDIVTRMVTEVMSRNLGQTMVVENRPGGGGRIGAEYITKVAPDGYQLLMTTNGTHTYMAVTEKNLSYDPVRDFTPIAQVGVYGLLMVVHPSVPANNLAEFIEYAKKNPGKVNYASSGMGSGLHFAGELFNHMAGVNMVHVPYKGSGPGMQDVISGACQVIFAGEAKSFIDAGRVRFIGTTSASRDPRFPNSPTLGEGALTGYDLSYWVGLFGPPGLPPDMKARLNAAVNASLADEGLRKRLADMGVVPTGGVPELLTQQIPVETAKLRKIASDARLQFN
jgi:tripartite-type tricarboxylate transporter receptor subunit TctC